MNCKDWEEQIALYAGGDLAPAEASESANIERHLAECAGCQVFLSGVKQSLGLLREVHREPIAAAHFTAMRTRVAARLKQGRVPWWRLSLIYGCACAAAALIAALAVRPGQTPTPAPRLALYRPPAQEAPAPIPSPQPPHAARVRRVRHEAHTLAQPKIRPAGQLVVKLIMDNPDVVIYWIAEKEGE